MNGDEGAVVYTRYFNSIRKLIVFGVLGICLIVSNASKNATYAASSNTVPNFIWPVRIDQYGDVYAGVRPGTMNVTNSGVTGELVINNETDLWLHVTTSGQPVTPVGSHWPWDFDNFVSPGGEISYFANYTLAGQGTQITATFDDKALAANLIFQVLKLIPGTGVLETDAALKIAKMVGNQYHLENAKNEIESIGANWAVAPIHLARAAWELKEFAGDEVFVNALQQLGMTTITSEFIKEVLKYIDIIDFLKTWYVDVIPFKLRSPNGVRYQFSADYIETSGQQPPSPEPPPLPLTYNATFLSHITYPDGNVVSPNQAITKTWRLRNSGTTTWGSGYQLAFVSGKQMGAPSAVNAPTATPGQEVNISVNLTAPTEPGKHRGYWQMRNPQGTYFGDRIWVEVEVPGAPGGSTPPSADAFILQCSDCPAVVTPGQTFRPVIEATVNSGQLVGGRGDMLRNIDGNLYGAWPHVSVEGIVDTGKTYEFSFYADNPIKAPSNLGTYESKWRLWQNGQFVGPELTIRFQVQNAAGINHPPNVPSLTGPGDWSVFTGGAPNLSAQHNGDPDGDPITHYYFDVFESHDIPKSGWISGNGWTPPGLGYYGYQWRVKVRDSRGAESAWSEVRHFTILNPQLSITQLSFVPLDGMAEVIRIMACASGPSTLRVDVNTANDGSANGEWRTMKELGVPCFNEIDAPTWDTLEMASGPHRVRVLARGDGGWDRAAVREEIYTVRADHRPNWVRNFTPKHETYINSRTVTFDWDDSLRTNNYVLQVSTQSNFSSLLLNVTLPYGTSQFTHTFDAEYQTLYTKVISNGPYGSNEAFSQFHIDQTPPASTITSLPGVVTEDKFTVGWSGSDGRSGLQWYHVQVRDGNRADSVWTDWMVNTTKTAEIFQGQPGRKYFFRVRAMDKIGNWEAWPGGDGDTNTLVDPTSVPGETWWNNSYTWKHNLVILNNDGATMPVHYPVRIHLDGSTTPTAAEVYNASMTATKGNDIRVVYQNTTELNRFVQYFSASRIDIWFPLAAVVGGGGTANGVYQLYYGNSSAGNPPANVNSVFLPEADGNTMGLWHFQEGTGATVNDSSGRSHHGTFTAPAWAEGLFGFTGSFGNGLAYVDTGNSADFNNSFTIEAWVKVDNVSTGHWPAIVTKKHNGVDGGYELRITDSKQVWFIMDTMVGNKWLVSNISLQPDRWYHIAAVYNGVDRQYIYINGVENKSLLDSGSPRTTTAPVRIGYGYRDNLPVSFPGDIQHLRISNVARYSFPYALVLNQPSATLGVARPRPVQGSADLRILFVNAYTTEDGTVLIEATIENTGNLATGNGFFTDIYVDHLPTGANDFTGSVRFWVNDPIPAYSTVTLATILDASGAALMGATTNNASSTPVETSGTLYAQVDSSGVVTEVDNANNITAQGSSFCIAEPDMFEEDDSAAEATLLEPNLDQTHNMHGLNDEDWYSVTLSAGQNYTFSTFDLGINADTYLYLYDQDGTTLIDTNDDIEESLASSISWTATATGTYYLRVTHWNPNGGGCGTAYTLLMVAGPRMSQISGAIYLNGSEDGLAGVLVSDGAGHETYTEEDGSYTLTDLPAGTFTLTPTKPNFSFSPAQITIVVPPHKSGQDFTATSTYSPGSRISVALDGTEGNDFSQYASVSADGRYVAFSSYASTLIGDDGNWAEDVFVRDTSLNTLERVSVSGEGMEADGSSWWPSISDDGRYITFVSWAENLVSNDGNWEKDVFLHDRHTGETLLVSQGISGNSSNGRSEWPSISPDGRYVAFSSLADDLVANDANNQEDVFVYDHETGEIELVSVDSFGEQGNRESNWPAISRGGNIIAFVSNADNLIEDDWNTVSDIFIHDRSTGQTTLGSIATDGTNANWYSFDPALSDDGRFLAFESFSTNLDPWPNGLNNIFLHDRQTGQTTIVSVASNGDRGDNWTNLPDISADGRYVVFHSGASNLVDGDTNDAWDLFMHDRLTSETWRPMLGISGSQANGESGRPSLSANGRLIAFESVASNLVEDDTNDVQDVFLLPVEVPVVYAISGIVLDSEGVPLEGARIYDQAGMTRKSQFTNADGEYELYLPAGSYELAAELDDYSFVPTTQSVVVPPAQTSIDFTGEFNPFQGMWLLPTDDAYVDQGTKTANYGTKVTLQVKNATTDMRSYLQFDVQGLPCGTLERATLYLLAKDAGPDGGNVYAVNGNWDETTINWNNSPALSGSPLGSLGEVVLNEWTAIDVTGALTGNGIYSFGISNDSNNLVSYSSKEGGEGPWLYVEYSSQPSKPDPRYEGTPRRGVAPLTVSFTNHTTGCPDEWRWGFGDGTTSTEWEPIHIYTEPGEYHVSLMAVNAYGQVVVDTLDPYIIVEEPTPIMYLSPTGTGNAGGKAFTGADILSYNKGANTWDIVYDGSYVKTPKNIDAFTSEGNDFLISFAAGQAVTGLGTFAGQDIARFTPTSLGYLNTAGSFTWAFDGSDVGLTTSGENIDALWIDDDGRFYISTTGSGEVPVNSVVPTGAKFKFQDEDVLRFTPTTLGANTSGKWELYWDTTGITGMGAEDIGGYWEDPTTGDRYVTMPGSFNVGNTAYGGKFAGNSKSVLRFTPNAGAPGGWMPAGIVDWLALGTTFPSNLDGLEMGR